MEGLAGLLDAARSPTPGEDLAGERAAVAGFLAARQRAVPAAPPERRNRAWVLPTVGATAMKVALGVAVLAFGGTALAARTGSLPTAAQERAHAMFSDVGVPAPASSARPTRTVTDGVTTAVPSPAPAPVRTATPGTSAAVTATANADLCRAWNVAKQGPPGKAVPARTRRALAVAAGGVPRIDEFCAGVLGETSSVPATGKSKGPEKPAVTGTPSHPAKGNGNGNGHDKEKSTGGEQLPIDAGRGPSPP
jgi:hypothetical protein